MLDVMKRSTPLQHESVYGIFQGHLEDKFHVLEEKCFVTMYLSLGQ